MDSFLRETLATPAKILRFIPRGAMGLWGLTFALVIQDFCSQSSWESLRDLILFPRLTLRPVSDHAHCSSKVNVAAVLRRVQAFRDGGFQALWAMAPPPRAPGAMRHRAQAHASLSAADKRERMSNPAFLATLNALMKDGAFSKAVKHLLSEGIHDAGDKAVQN